jgi:hypothetical protein
MLNKNVNLEFSAHGAFLESTSSSTLKRKKRLVSQIVIIKICLVENPFHFLLIHIAFKIIALIEVLCFVSVKTNPVVKLVS